MDFFGTPLVIEPWAGQLSLSAGLLLERIDPREKTSLARPADRSPELGRARSRGQFVSVYFSIRKMN
jgi:hypothetical protein